MRQGGIYILLLILVGFLIFKENRIKRPEVPLADGCLFCHQEMADSDPSHPVKVFGCSECHMGNGHSLDEDRAHATMIKNPGDLRFVDKTCGKSGCHGDIAGRVKKSLMATNIGIIRIIQEEWGKEAGRLPVQSVSVADLYGKQAPRNLPIDLYRKLCGGCHLWKPKGDLKTEKGRRGGGCSDCHVMDVIEAKRSNGTPVSHPRITTRIPSENCVKCHNRSARMGLSYYGRFESAGYGTPYKGGELSPRKLSGGRFYLNFAPDIHFEKAKMTCIDCHTATGLMGDGKRHERMAEQVDITCKACHAPRFRKFGGPDALEARLVFLNKKVPASDKRRIAVSRKGTPLYNVQKMGDETVFYRKDDGQKIPFEPLSGASYHGLKGHERLSCQACHSPLVPQCYGCHLTYETSENQHDWISGEKTPGKWIEHRSYLRFQKPPLGFRGDGRVYPISPCQVFFNAFDGAGNLMKNRSFINLNLSAFDPHTTRKTSRTCLDCHADPKTLGLGEGILYQRGDERIFRPTSDAAASGLGLPFALDQLVRIDGKPLQKGSSNGVRPFDHSELDRILRVKPCLRCHSSHEDRIYENFGKSLHRFKTDKTLPCLN